MKDPKCEKCHFIFLPSSRQFYCCDQTKKYCIICRRVSCPTCGNMISKQVQVPRCQKCYAVEEKPGQMLREPNCGSHYCGKCVVTKILTKTDRFYELDVVFPCGHRVDLPIVTQFMQNLCFLCGHRYDGSIDFQLLNGNKCCFMCVKYENEKVQDLILNCMNCGDSIRKMSEAGTLDNDFILCRNCTTFSQMEEKHFSEIQFNKIDDNSIKKEGNSHQQNVPPYSSSNNKDISSIGAENKSQTQKKKEVSNINEDREKSKEGQKKEQMKKQYSNLKKTILERFPSMKQMPQTKLKKHMSMETFIENMKIQIEPQKGEIIECDECNYEIEEKENMQIEGDRRYCRLCYALVNTSKILGFNNRNSKEQLVDSRRKFKSGHKHSNVLNIPTNTDTKFGKQSGNFENYRMASTAKPTVIEYKSYDSHPKSECSMCKKIGQPVIKTARNGDVCFTCYYQKK